MRFDELNRAIITLSNELHVKHSDHMLVDQIEQPLESFCSSLAIGLGSLAYRSALASDLAPFSYSGLIWSLGVTWIVWGTVPGAATFLGAAIIASSAFLHVVSARRSAARATRARRRPSRRGRRASRPVVEIWSINP